MYVTTCAYHIELLLQFLVGVVDTKLLEIVHSKHLKSVDVQYSDEGGVTRRERDKS